MRRLTSLLFAVLLAAPVLAHAAAGQVLFALGRVEIQRGDKTIVAGRGTPFEPGDTINTGPTGMAQLRFKDGALMSLRHGSTIRIEDFHFPEPTPKPGELAAAIEARRSGTSVEGGRSVLRLVRGAFRTITGLIGKGANDQYRVATPAATIGIRGTDYTAAYCEANCGSSEDGLYVGVSSGEVAVQNDAGEMPVGEGEYSYTRDSSTPPEQEMAPPAALDQPTPTEEESEGEAESGDEPAPEGTIEGGSEESASSEGGESSTESGDSGTTDSGSTDSGSTDSGSTDTAGGDTGGTTTGGTDASSSDASGWGGGTTTTSSASDSPTLTSSPTPTNTTTTTTTTETVPPPPPPPPATYTAPVATVTPANFAFAYGGARGAGTNGVVLSAADVVRFTDGATYEIGSSVNKNQGFDGALRWGRWSGGTATVDGAALSLAAQSLHWIYATSPTAPVIPITGTANYTLIGNTNPTDAAGNVGVLGTAHLSVDFTSQTVNSTLNLGINNQAWSASGSGTLASPLFSGTYGVSVNDSLGGFLGTGTGDFGGFLSGTSAGLTYNLDALGSTVSGAAAFGQAPTQAPQ